MLLSHADAYLTWKQIEELGGKVKKGAKAEIVTFWKMYPVEEEDKEGNKVKKNIPLLRYYNVFWIGDTEGIERKEVERVAHDPIEEAEAIINGYMSSDNHPTIERDKTSDKAYYSPLYDKVVVPTIEQYKEVAEYYSTLFHELTNSTGHATRLNRLASVAHFGSEEYSKEELVAEIGAATLVNMAGIETSASFNNSAAYIEGWSKALRDNVKMIVEASSKAAKAVDYILQNKPETNDDDNAGDTKAPAKEDKPAKKTNTAKVYEKLEKTINKAKIKSPGSCAGQYNSMTYACDGHYILRTTEKVTDNTTEESNARTLDRCLSETDKALTSTGNVGLTVKELKEGIKAAKNGKRNAKVMYTTPDGITLNTNFLLNAMTATGTTEYKFNSEKPEKSPIIFENDNTTFLVLPIKPTAAVKVGFTAV
jgi:antirestriction protein ArdC